jgi:hypothetical protein
VLDGRIAERSAAGRRLPCRHRKALSPGCRPWARRRRVMTRDIVLRLKQATVEASLPVAWRGARAIFLAPGCGWLDPEGEATALEEVPASSCCVWARGPQSEVRTSAARQGRGRSFNSGHGNGPPAHRTEVRLANPSASTPADRAKRSSSGPSLGAGSRCACLWRMPHRTNAWRIGRPPTALSSIEPAQRP